ncbi:MAG: hypothetical protein BWY89_00172 [Bacteroidetes bacterium ADurb.BinA012]|nr:MAG: hypothetical protein BWY89_00172 [Bacteroidetes bacterium ADurb.BinA012]
MNNDAGFACLEVESPAAVGHLFIAKAHAADGAGLRGSLHLLQELDLAVKVCKVGLQGELAVVGVLDGVARIDIQGIGENGTGQPVIPGAVACVGSQP